MSISIDITFSELLTNYYICPTFRDILIIFLRSMKFSFYERALKTYAKCTFKKRNNASYGYSYYTELKII